MALVKYNNNSISDITSAASVPSGAMTLIKTLTASSSSTLSFVDGSSDVVLDSTYPIYVFKFINLHHSADGGQISFQGNAAGGSGYNETLTTTTFEAYHKEDDSATSLAYTTGNDLAQSTSFQMLFPDMSNDNDGGSSGELWLFGLSSTTYVKHFIFRGAMHHRADYAFDLYCAGYFNTTSAIDEIQFKPNTGTIDAGTIKLYGIKDS
jgi:hypothetical protein